MRKEMIAANIMNAVTILLSLAMLLSFAMAASIEGFAMLDSTSFRLACMALLSFMRLAAWRVGPWRIRWVRHA